MTGEIIVDAEGGNNKGENTDTSGAITFVDENEKDEEDSTDRKIEIDPDTGYAIDPTSGVLVDPSTGEPVDPAVSNLE